MSLENISGNLQSAYFQAKASTILHVDELMAERRLNLSLRDLWFYTADGMIYFLNQGIPMLAITRQKDNPLFQRSAIKEYCSQLLSIGNYYPTAEETSAAIYSPDTVCIDLTQIKLCGTKGVPWDYLTINTASPQKLNEEEMKLARRIYGQDDYRENLRMLATAGIRVTRILLLRADDVQELGKRGSFGRSTWLKNFRCNSGFSAYDYYIHDTENCVRAERVSVA